MHHGVKLERHVTNSGLRHADDDGDDNDEENVQYILAYGYIITSKIIQCK